MSPFREIIDLHDCLSSWTGLGAALVAFTRQLRSFQRVNPTVLSSVVLCGAIAALHITIPSVVSVDSTISIVHTSIQTFRLPGSISAVVGEEGSDYVADAMASVPHFWNHTSSSDAATGWNGTTFFSTPETALPSEMIFQDPHAGRLSVVCGVIPSNNDSAHPAIKLQPGTYPWTTTNTIFTWGGNISYALPDGTEYNSTSGFEFIGEYVDDSTFGFGGGKPQLDSPPNIKFDDMLWLDYNRLSGTADPYGSYIVNFFSLKNNSLRLPPDRILAPPISVVIKAPVWSWVNNASLSLLEMQENTAFLENATFTIYYWALSCSLFLDNTSALVRGDGSLYSVNAPAVSHITPTPFMRPLPDTAIERKFVELVAAVEAIITERFESGNMAPAPSWTETTLQNAIVAGGLAELENTWSRLVALEYALLIQTWKALYEQNSSSVTDPVANYWTPQSATLTGTQPKAFARLRINIPQLVVGGFSSLLLVLATLVLIHSDNPDRHDSIIRDGGLLDTICLLEGSSLPDTIAGPVSIGEARDVDAVRRERAELTMVAYGNACLDTPDRIQRRLVEHVGNISDETLTISLLGLQPQESAMGTDDIITFS